MLIQLISLFPNLFPFEILDYNTTKGIDFVVKEKLPRGYANGDVTKYVELKGTLTGTMNHPFELISCVICYEVKMQNKGRVTDSQGLSYQITPIEKLDVQLNECENPISFTYYKLNKVVREPDENNKNPVIDEAFPIFVYSLKEILQGLKADFIDPKE